MIKIKLMCSFIKWMFMNIFGGCFNLAEKFRYELKKGAPDSIFAIAGFLILSVVTFMVVGLLAVWLAPSKEIAGAIISIYFVLTIATFIYNALKAAFECFIAERARLFEILRDCK